MIVDCHTHVFPPWVIDDREGFIRADPTFGELYSSPKTKLAAAEDLLRSMDEAEIDMSVALGFAWREPEACRDHNQYLLEAAAKSNGRIVPFPTLPLGAGHAAIEAEMRRCINAGALGFGELRPDDLGFDLDGPPGDDLAALAREAGCVLLFHVSEPVGHVYGGKAGLAIGAFYRFVARHPGMKAIGAHWGGGLPFHAPMPEVKQLFGPNLGVDTAATSLLYDDTIYEHVTALIGPEHILFGTDFPLLGQKRSRHRIEESGLDEEARRLILGGNATRLLGLK